MRGDPRIHPQGVFALHRLGWGGVFDELAPAQPYEDDVRHRPTDAVWWNSDDQEPWSWDRCESQHSETTISLVWNKTTGWQVDARGNYLLICAKLSEFFEIYLAHS